LVADYFKWDINEESFSIRGSIRGRVFCPITAVAYSLYGNKYRVNRWEEAAKFIGLPKWIATNIAQAADSGVLFDGELEPYYQELARRVEQ
jgi:hypothetical protein